MKKILLILSIFCISTAYSQDSTKVDTSKLTAKQIYEDAKTGFKEAFSGLKDVAAKLEGPAKHVYRVYTYQHRASGIASLIVSLTSLLFFLTIALRLWKKADFDENPKESVFFVISVVCTVACILICSANLSYYLTKILNPEYYAIQDIIQTFK